MFKRNEEDEEALILIKSIIDDAKGKIPARNDSFKDEADLIRFKAATEPISISNHIKKEFYNFIKNYQNQDDVNDIPLLERTFLGKLISVSSILPTLNFPSSKSSRRASTNFIAKNDHILGQDNFRTKYLLKSLDIIVFQDILDYLVKINCKIKDEIILNSSNMNTLRDSNNDKVYSKQAQQLLSWRPSGKLLSTLYDHKSSVEKIIPMNFENYNIFLSFSNDGQIFLWDIQTQDNDFTTEKILEHNIEDIEFKAISTIDNYSFAVANKNKTIEIYKVNFYLI